MRPYQQTCCNNQVQLSDIAVVTDLIAQQLKRFLHIITTQQAAGMYHSIVPNLSQLSGLT